jgi:hypothetical protein
MSYTRKRMMQEIHDIQGMNKPSVSRLLAHIFSSAFSSSMFTLMALGTAIIVFIGYHNIPTGNYFALLFSTIIVLAFLSGCKAWQQDLNDYQQSLADARHTYNSQPR